MLCRICGIPLYFHRIHIECARAVLEEPDRYPEKLVQAATAAWARHVKKRQKKERRRMRRRFAILRKAKWVK